MAKVQFGNIVADARNAVGGIVYARNTWGAYIRQKVSPVQPRSPRQQEMRANLTELSKRWGTGLTEEQREAWRQFAAAFPIVDVFGNTIALTGIAAYQRVNRVRAILGLPPLDDPPANMDVVAPESVTLQITWEGSPPGLRLKVAFTPSPTPANHRLAVWATKGMSPGRAFVSSELRLVAVAPANQASPFDFTAFYLERLGLPSVGQKVFVEVRFVNETNGAQSRGLRASAIVPLAS
jgi:hypothetical protein